MQFETKFLEIRPSGTDAKTKAYAAGINKAEIEKLKKANQSIKYFTELFDNQQILPIDEKGVLKFNCGIKNITI